MISINPGTCLIGQHLSNQMLRVIACNVASANTMRGSHCVWENRNNKVFGWLWYCLILSIIALVAWQISRTLVLQQCSHKKHELQVQNFFLQKAFQSGSQSYSKQPNTNNHYCVNDNVDTDTWLLFDFSFSELTYNFPMHWGFSQIAARVLPHYAGTATMAPMQTLTGRGVVLA